MNRADKNTLLIVEDNPADKTHLLRILESVAHNFTNIVTIQTYSQAKEYFLTQPPECCLLDCNLIGGTASKLLEDIQTQPGVTQCPIIIITGSENIPNAVNLMKKGVMDYLPKPVQSGNELVKIINQAQKTWELQNQLNYLALHDPLTGLINRNLFVDRLTQLFNKYKRSRDPFALVYIDLDEFKLINDQYGHEAGDYVLSTFSNKLTKYLRDTDTAARLGGDEFAILLPNTDKEQSLNVVKDLLEHLTFNVKWNDTNLFIRLSMGLACCPDGALDYKELMREADFALYQSKNNGRGQCSIFDQKMENDVLASREISRCLAQAIENGDLDVFYQPIFNAQTLNVVEVEALVRWHFNDTWVPPEKIINCMMEQNLSKPFHNWLFNKSFSQLKHWKKSIPNLTMAVNLPANLPTDNTVLSNLESIMKHLELDFKDLIIEITESHFMRHPKEAQKQLKKLNGKKTKVAIDDFGTGFSSMQYLATLPCDQLKIDKIFFLAINNHKNKKIIKSITSLAENLDLDSVAEGIESEYLVEQAKELGCKKLQGFWLGAPVAGHTDFNEFLKLSKKEGIKLLTTYEVVE